MNRSDHFSRKPVISLRNRRVKTILLPVLALLGCLAYNCSADTLIDDFGAANSPSPWTFSNGPEFPGATGSLTLGAGYLGGHSAQLAYDLSKGGNYTAAYLKLPAPLTTEALSFWLKTPPNVKITLRVTDSTGQTFQYYLSRPPQSLDAGSWYQETVALNAPTNWFSGANDGTVHEPIDSIGILATNGIEPNPVGSINFTDIYAITSPSFTLNPAVPLIPPNSGTAGLLDGMGVAIHATNDVAELNAAQSAGFSWVRTDLAWSSVETSANVYNWSAFDQLVSLLQARGMKVLFILDYGNPLYTGSAMAPPMTVSAVAAFARFAQAAAAHFSGTGSRFEVWNEANISHFWAPAPNPSQYAMMAAAATAAVHAGDPNALVTTTGLAGFDFTFAAGFLADGGGAGANAIGVHPYDVADAPGDLPDYFNNLESIVLADLPGALPIWDTEWGYSSSKLSADGASGMDPAAERAQGVLVAKEILSAYAVGFPIYIYYDLLDDGTDPANSEYNFGLLAPDYSDKPAMTAVRQLKAFAAGRKFSGFIPTLSGLVAMKFSGPSDSVVALWTDVPNFQTTISMAGAASAADVMGSTLPITNDSLTVSDAAGPVYITFTDNAWLSNLSARAQVQGGANLLIAGFVTTGVGDKALLIRGDGPALEAFGVSGSLTDPKLTLLDSTGTSIASTNSWPTSLESTFAQVGAFQLSSGSHDTAILTSVAPGAYTAQVASASTNTGVALAEIYDADSGAPRNRLINISARALVSSGSNVLIGGFVIGGTGDETLLIRADGPALSGFGVSGALANPVLTLLNAAGGVIATNSGWNNPSVQGSSAVLSGPRETVVQSADAAIFNQLGAFALSDGSADSAFVVTLPPGSYTAQVSASGTNTGIALVEIYEVR